MKGEIQCIDLSIVTMSILYFWLLDCTFKICLGEINIFFSRVGIMHLFKINVSYYLILHYYC